MTARAACVVVVAAAAAACSSPHAGSVDAPSGVSADAPAIDAVGGPDALPDAGPLVPVGPDPFGPLLHSSPACSDDHWCWTTPAPHGNAYDHIFSTAPDNIWLTAWGFIEQWDGHAWTSHHPPIGAGLLGSQFPMSIGGSSPTNTWLIYGPQLEHWDGSTWTIVETLPNSGSPNYNNVWCSPDGDAWVTISNGTLEHWHGDVETKVGAGDYLGSIWGTSATDIYITTLPAGVLHYDGAMFTRIYNGPNIYGGYSGVAGDVWISSGNGGLAHWDGKNFTEVPLPANEPAELWVQPIAYRAANDVWWFVLLSNGGFLHWDGTGLTFTQIAPTDDIGLSDFNDGAIIGGRWWLVGGYGAIYTASTPYSTGVVPSVVPITEDPWYPMSSLWAGADDDVYATAGFTLQHYDGSAATTVPLDLGAIYGSVTYVTGLRSGGVDELYVAGQVQTVAGFPGEYVDVVFHYDGTTWTRASFDTAPANMGCGIGTIVTLGPGEALGVGACGVAFHFAHGAWTPITTNTTEQLLNVWARDANHVWIVGTNRTVLQWDRSAPTVLTPDPVPASQTVNADGTPMSIGAITGVGGFPWIAANELGYGTIYERSATGWTEVVSPVTGDATAAFVAISPTNIVFSNDGQANIYRYNGTTWTYEDNASYLATNYVSAVPGGHTWAGGDNGLVSHP